MADEEKKEKPLTEPIPHTPVDKDERFAEINRIAEAREAELEESGDVEEIVHEDEITEEPEPEAAEGEEATEETDEEDAVEAELEEEEPEELIKIVVDGEEQEVPLSEILDAGKRTLQKSATADKRLQEATELLKSAREQAQEPQAAGDPPEETGDTQSEVDNVKSKFLELANKLQYGSEEEAALAVQSLVELGQKQGASEDKINETVRAAIQEAEIQKRNAAIQAKVQDTPENGGFSDLLEISPNMIMVLAERSQRLLDKGEPNDWDTYRKAGETLREELSMTTKTKAAFEEKRQRKASVKTIEGANKRPATPVPKKEPTPSQTIREIAKARGQAEVY